ncbi:MAG: hypothetical protein KatS3mg121_0682 [Gammaproteobacteria bacterium]|nr:MAG: hypothetical protein KatS3mg121_0682 [Gammaproteobacteria bacterium]
MSRKARFLIGLALAGGAGTAFAQLGNNLALGAGADGSSKASGTSYGNVVDGNPSTYWQPTSASGQRISVKNFNAAFNTVVIRELNGATRAWRLVNNDTGAVLASGTTLGSAAVIGGFGTVSMSKVNLMIDSAVSPPQIAEFELYNSAGGASSSVSSSSSSSASSSSAAGGSGNRVTLQENALGFCGVDGAVESEWGGYTGAGYANTENTMGASVYWRVRGGAGSYTFRWRFANGSSAGRTGVLWVNGARLATRDFGPTGGWGSWATTSVTLNLGGGDLDLRLEGTGSAALPNIDYLEVTGPGVSAIACGGGSGGSSSSSAGGGGSSSSSSSSAGGGGSITGSSCRAGGQVIVVNETIRVTSGVFDGGCNTYTASSALGDGSQSESQKPIFRIENGATLRNVYIGANGADGIHVYNGGIIENVYWSDVGEDALTIKSEGTVNVRNISGFDAEDKFFQVNAPSTLNVSNCIIHRASKALRQNGGTTYKIVVNFDRCDIADMKEGVFRTDSSVSEASLTNSRLHNAGTVCIGPWARCHQSGNSTY